MAASESESRFAAHRPGFDAELPDIGLYSGYGGIAAALHMWSLVSGDDQARADARVLTGQIAAIAATAPPATQWRDVVSGQAGVLLIRRLIQLGSRPDGTMAVPHSIPLADPAAPIS